MSHSDSTIERYLAEHPRMIGVLFMVLVLLTQMGAAAASNGSVNVGP
ncbi:MAG: hypothetical protein ABEI98_06025 [Halorhabdus sp.]